MCPVSRKWRKSNRKKKSGQNNTASKPKAITEEQKRFSEALTKLATVGGFSNHVSMVLTGLPTSKNGEMASVVHAKMCAHARSIGAICASSMFDHGAIFSLARMMVEAMTMYFYLREDVSDDEGRLRFLVIKLHDTAARIKLLRAWHERSKYEDLRSGRDDLTQQIRENAFFCKLSEDQQRRLLSGEEIFVGGMRRAAIRAAGWREENFIAIYNYFSAHTHSAPMSYLRAKQHAVDYYAPSEAQYGMAGLALEVAISCLRRVTNPTRKYVTFS